MDPYLLGDLLHVVDLDPQTVRGDRADVGDLAARLRVQRAAVEDDLDVLAGGRRGDAHTVRDERQHVRLGHQLVEAGELRGAAVDELLVDREIGVRVLACLRILLGPLPLLGHQRAEAVLVDAQAGLGRHLERQVDRETVGVVEHERSLPPKTFLPAAFTSSASASTHLRAGRDGAQERGLLTTATPTMRSKSVASSGYDWDIVSRTTVTNSRMLGFSAPSSFADRMMRRSRRRST